MLRISCKEIELSVFASLINLCNSFLYCLYVPSKPFNLNDNAFSAFTSVRGLNLKPVALTINSLPESIGLSYLSLGFSSVNSR